MTPDPDAALDFLKALRDLCQQYHAAMAPTPGTAAGVGFRGLAVGASGLECELVTAAGARAVRLDFAWVSREK